MTKEHITSITIEHVVVKSSRSYEQVKKSLEEKMSMVGDIDEFIQQLVAAKASWEQVKQTIEKRLGKGGFSIFGKVEHGRLLSLAGKPSKVIQYAIGNPLFAIQMVEYVPAVALYAPLRLVVYEDKAGTFVVYDRFSSLLSQFKNEKIAHIAELVEQELEELVVEVTGGK